MGFLTRLFGQCGTIRYIGTTYDGKEFKGTTRVEMFGISKEELEERLKNTLFVKEGIKAKTLNIIGFCED